MCCSGVSAWGPQGECRPLTCAALLTVNLSRTAVSLTAPNVPLWFHCRRSLQFGGDMIEEASEEIIRKIFKKNFLIIKLILFSEWNRIKIIAVIY